MQVLKGSPASTAMTEKAARDTGLDKIDFEKTYNLYKTGAKTPSPLGYSDTMLAMENGKVNLVCAIDSRNGLNYVIWIAVVGDGTWFRTSPILSCKKDGVNCSLETENSFYELRAQLT